MKHKYVRMLEVLAHLCEQGGDPTHTNKQGKTAKEIAQTKDIKIAVALLGMCYICTDTFWYLELMYRNT